jgi:hypothetical protein
MAQSASPSQPHAFIFVEQNGSGPKVTSRGRAATSITQRPRTRSTTASLQLDLRPNNSAASITMADSSTTNTDHNNTSDQAQAQIAPAQLADISPPAGRENPEGSRSRPGSAVKTSRSQDRPLWLPKRPARSSTSRSNWLRQKQETARCSTSSATALTTSGTRSVGFARSSTMTARRSAGSGQSSRTGNCRALILVKRGPLIRR